MLEAVGPRPKRNPLERDLVTRGEQGIQQSLPSLDSASFIYVPNAKSPDSVVLYTPNVVNTEFTIAGVKITGQRGPRP